jgi:uncharacterized protein (TIGR02678 family)
LKELEILLENFWIIKDRDPDLYHMVKDASPKFKDFVEEKMGCKVIVNAYMIKLEKLPGKAESWMGIQQFTSTMEYAFFCILLMFLEDRGAKDQFVLSQVTEFIQSTFPGDEKVDWTLFSHRRSLVRVLKFAAELGLISVDDGNDQKFMESVETEVLYESTGLSRYFVRNFTGNILNYSSWEDIEKGEWLDADRDRGRVRRNRVYRRVILSPAVYSEGADDSDYAYIKNFRGLIQKDIEDMLESDLHVHRNGAFLVLNPGMYFKDVFPDNKTISDIALQINGLVIEKVRKNELVRNSDDVIAVSRPQFENIVEECRDMYSGGWSKEYREMRMEQLCNDIISYMSGFGIVDDRGDGEIRIMPLAGKITGCYPEDFTAAG